MQRYQSRISGPLLDRIDLQVRVPQLRHETLTKLERRSDTRQSIKFLRQRVESARLRQLDRQGHTNSWLDAARLRSEMTRAGLDESFLTTILQKFQLSARSYHKVWRIARTIADLDEKDAICQAHVVEALGFRSLPWEQGVR